MDLDGMASRLSGRVVFGLGKEGVVCGVFLDWDGVRGHVLTAEGRQEVWSEERIIWISSLSIPLRSLPEAREALQGFAGRVLEHIPQVDLETLWDLVADEERDFSVTEIAEIAFTRPNHEQVAAVACVLATPNPYFRKGKGPFDFRPYSREASAQIITRMQRMAQEEALLEDVAQTLSKALNPSSVEAKEGSCQKAEEGLRDERLRQMGIDWLRALALGNLEGQKAERAKRLLRMLTDREPREPEIQAFEILVKLDVFDEDEILGLHRFGIRTEFPEEVEEEAQRLVEELGKAEFSERPRLVTNLGPIAIDDPWTTEVDDALMLEEVHGGWRVHVLIADPTACVPFGSLTAREGMSRASTLYLPTGKVLMFPSSISEKACSLERGRLVPMLDFCADLCSDGTVEGFEIVPVLAEVQRRMTYEEVDALLAEGAGNDPLSQYLQTLCGIGRLLRARREQAGAVLIARDDVVVKVIDGEIVVKRLRGTSEARQTVGEFMVLACTQSGRFARERGIPVVYRRQSPPDIKLDPSEERDLVPGSKAWAYRVLRTLKKAELSIHPEFHYGLGVIGYTQVTSPLRRFQDYLVHLQLKGYLEKGKAPLDGDSLLRTFGDLDGRGEALAQVEREAKQYYLLKYLSRFVGSKVEGEVIAIHGSKAVVELIETGLEVAVSGGGRPPLGSRVSVIIDYVDPRRNRISVRLA